MRFLAVVPVFALAALAVADGLPDGIGVQVPSGSVVTTEIYATPSAGPDADDYVFQGFPGMKLQATVKATKGSAFVPELVVLRPGGAIVGDDEGLTATATPTSATAKLTLDVVGWWKVRVQGAPLTRDEFGAPLTRSTGAYSVTLKYTPSAIPALPAASKSFKASATVFPAGDTDEFAFQGWDGQAFSGALTLARGSALDPVVRLVRPDGSIAQTFGLGTKETRALALSASTLDADGTWRVRVVGERPMPTTAEPNPAPTTGAYTLSVKLGKATNAGLSPDANGQYRLRVPAVGGAAIGATLVFKGATPTFNSFVDPEGRPVTGFPGGTSVKGFRLVATAPLGDYVLTFDAPAGAVPTNVALVRTLAPAKPEKKIVRTMSRDEPVIFLSAIVPTTGGPGTPMSVKATGLVDPAYPVETDDDGHVLNVGLWLDHHRLTDLRLQGADTITGKVPTDLPEGQFDVIVTSTAGQPAAAAKAFRRVPPPKVSGIDPTVGPGSGHFPITITGANFRPTPTGGLPVMGILLDGFLQPLTPSYVDETTIRFDAPARPAGGLVSFGVRDLVTLLDATKTSDNRTLDFEYVATAAISRLVPSLIPELGNELVTIQGANFQPTDHVFLQLAGGGGFEEITTTQTTYDAATGFHRFTAPVRPHGQYLVYVQDALGQPNPPKTRVLTYYSYAIAATNLGSLGADLYDAVTTAVADYDKDAAARQDLFVSRRGDPADTAAAATSLTRVLRQTADGEFADVTTSVMPAVTNDDWRADRVWTSDVNVDGWPDLVLTTNAVAVPPLGRSHTRILINEPRGGIGAAGAERVFRDRTIDLMAPARQMQLYGVFGGPSDFYVADDWRALDMWVGDIDRGDPGPPEILITHDEVKNDDNPSSDVFLSGVYCGNYCSSQNGNSTFYSYTFYWGGSRLFIWNKAARAGQGQFKFDAAFFPRASGPVVPQSGGPAGVIPACSPHYNSICKGTFTPFIGQRVTVGNLDFEATGGNKPDVVVVSNQDVTRVPGDHVAIGTTPVLISSTQVGINKFDSKNGSGVTDMTDVVGAIGGDFRGDAATVGQPGFPDGNSFGVIALTKATASSGTVMRLIKTKPTTTAGKVCDFEEITTSALPSPDADEHFQASALRFIDTDQDGDQDLVLVAPSALGGTKPAFRILRNERVGTQVGFLRRTLEPLFAANVTASEHFESDSLTVGDVTGDGFLDFVLARATSTGVGAQTRILKTDR
jgi:hypothetical protein